MLDATHGRKLRGQLVREHITKLNHEVGQFGGVGLWGRVTGWDLTGESEANGMSAITFSKSRIKMHPYVMKGYLGPSGDVSFFVLAIPARGGSREASTGAIRSIRAGGA